MINKYTNKQRGLLAVIMAMVMVFAGAAFVAAEVDGAKITYISGEIMDNQEYGQGAIVVMNGDLTIEDGKSLIIAQGASFTVQEGFTLTINKDAKLIVYNGAYFNAIGDVEVKTGGSIENAAAYNGTTKVNGSYAGFFVNGTIDVAKGGKITGATINASTSSGTAAEVAPIVDQATNTTITGITATVDDDTYYLSGNDVPYHMNGAGNYGYWVGVKLTDNNYYYASAGTIREVTIGNDTYTIDATNVNLGKTGQMVVNGAIKTASTGTTYSEIKDQLISVTDGASLSVKGKVTDTTISAFTTANVVNTYGSITVDGNGTGAVDFKVTIVTEKIANAFIVTDADESKATTKAVNLILDVNGTIENGNTMTVNTTAADAGVDQKLVYATADGKTASDIEINGTVRVSEELTVGAGGSFVTKEKSILDVDGTITVKGKDSTNFAEIVLDGITYVSGNVNIDSVDGTDKTVKLDLSDNYTTSRTAYIVIEGDGTITIKDYDPSLNSWANSPAGLLGATYAIDDVFYASNLVSAIEAVVAANESDVTVWGLPVNAPVIDKAYVIGTDVTIPEVDLTFMYNVIIDEDVTLTITEDASISAGSPGAVIIVDGIMIDYTLETLEYADVTPSIYELLVDAEVKAIDADETYYKYTTLSNALSTAVDGETIQLFGNVTLKDNLTIPAGITVDTNNYSITVPVNKVLTVDGTLDMVAGGSVILKDANAANTWDSDGKIIVNNMIVEPSIKLEANDTVIAGIYANGTIGDYEDADFLLAPAVAAENSSVISNATVDAETTYNGDLTFTAGEDNTAVLTVNSKFTVGTITIVGYEIIISNVDGSDVDTDADAIFTGKVAATNGALDLKNVKSVTDTGKEIVIANVVDEDAGTDVLTIAGKPVMVDKDGKVLAPTDAKKNVASISIASGTVTVDKSATLDVSNLGFTVAEGTVLDVNGTVTFNKMTIAGTANINGGANLTGTTDAVLEILGTLFVKQATADDGAKGTVTVNGDVFVGVLKKSIVSGTATIDAAEINGCNVMYVAAGSSIPEELVEEVDSIQFIIEDSLYITAYQMKNTSLVATVEKAPVENAKFLGWNNDKGKLITDGATTDPKAVYEISFEKYDKVTAAIDYNIYTVNIVADNGIGTVAIDGIVLQKNGNTFSASKLVAGEHTLSYELKNGYEGTVKMTVDGEAVDGYKFTLSGTDAEDLVVDINLSGTTQIEYSTATDSGEDDGGMTLVEILLIVLVVLVVILAIIVALRMMRS